MSGNTNVKLPLTKEEKMRLRKAKVKLGQVHNQELDDLALILDESMDRAKVIKGVATFQQVPSIGHKLAEKIVYNLGISTLEEIKDESGAQLLDKLEQNLGVWTDPCVEDQIRCVINYANNPKSPRQWFDFTEERNLYRQRNGYPHSRPNKAWYE
ncbi:helix-hairpin-helix domain-containing protein [Tuberibacillus sp. Marseille-P3662]|uniref:helix-hairpin-helix domain-containing protein n=1 Tax=Tuberibacillus sp. Marseille-P3662 TaxID=1965358 RepID=UPI0020CAF820|nr:helix-hairpin-helix domain-containing protein [Tuberibacillus sp. Marseille-P3662]